MLFLLFYDKHSHKHWRKNKNKNKNCQPHVLLSWLAEYWRYLSALTISNSSHPISPNLCSLTPVAPTRVEPLPPTPSRTYMLPNPKCPLAFFLLDLLTPNPKSVWASAEWVYYSHMSRGETKMLFLKHRNDSKNRCGFSFCQGNQFKGD